MKRAQNEAKELPPEIQEIYLELLKELNSLSELLASFYASRGIATYEASQRISLTTLSEHSVSRERGFFQLLQALPHQSGFFNMQSPAHAFPANTQRSKDHVSEPNKHEERVTQAALPEQSDLEEQTLLPLTQALPHQPGLFNRRSGSQSPEYDASPADIQRSDDGVSEPNEYEVRRTPVTRK